MPYAVKEMYYTLQGEGHYCGRAAVFCRFTGCNLWNGKEEDRAAAPCWFCDTDFLGTDGVGGGKFQTASALAEKIEQTWFDSTSHQAPMVVFTGGEPLLQLDEALLEACKKKGFFTAVETNGTIAAPKGLDWITVSPKPNSPLRQRSGSELKLVYPHDVQPEALSELDFKYFFLSPLNSSLQSETEKNTKAAVEFCLKNPQWQLTMQAHKLWGIP